MSGMNDRDRAILDTNMPAMMQDLNVEKAVKALQDLDSQIMPKWIADEFLKSDVKPSERIHMFINKLKQRGPNAFNLFCKALDKTHQHKLLRLLDPTSQPHDENGAHPKPVVDDDDDESAPLVHELTQLQIKDNEKFYAVEKSRLTVAKQTRGIIEDLVVDQMDGKHPALVEFDESDTYPCFSSPRGLALIVNNRNFTGPPSEKLPDRLGTDVDRTNMKKVLEMLGYSVKVKENLTGQEMVHALQRFSLKDDHKRLDSAIVVVLTHGQLGHLYGTDGKLVSIETLISALNAKYCPSLAGKPKVFILQACRGEKYDAGDLPDGLGSELADAGKNGGGDGNTSLTLQRLVELDEVDANSMRMKIPTDADILTCYATTPGYVSWRNSQRGSWFIQSICEVFGEYASKEDILSMLTRVNKRVAEAFTSSSGHKQIPAPSTTLRSKFYFFPGVKGRPTPSVTISGDKTK